MTTKKMFEMALVGVLAAAGGLGCVGNAAPVGEQQSAVSGGVRTQTGNFPFVVQLDIGCTASKIGPRRFLTAAHCLDDGALQSGDLVGMTTDADGLAGGAGIDVAIVANVFIHPSWEQAPVTTDGFGQRSRDSGRVYDVAVLDVRTDTPDIETVAITHDYFGDQSPNFFLVGYGADAVTPAESGKKQYAVFDMADLDFWWDNSDYSADKKRGAFRHNIIGWTDDQDDGNQGDSGGPFLMFRNNRWELLGVLSAIGLSGAEAPFLWGARTSNVWRWIANPGKNDFRNDSIGYLMNAKSGKCADLLRSNLDNEAAVVQYWCEDDHSSTQRLRLVDVGGGLFQLRDEGSGRCFSGRSPGFGDKVAQFDCSETDTLQRWHFEARGNGVFQLRNKSKNACLGVDGGSVDDEAKLGIWSCDGTSNQGWVFTR